MNQQKKIIKNRNSSFRKKIKKNQILKIKEIKK